MGEEAALLIAYLDTHVSLWLVQGRTEKLSQAARRAVERFDLRISPMVLLELGYLYEIRRAPIAAVPAAAKLQAELGLEVCPYPFPKVAYAALSETWTRDSFDRLIVSHAKANAMAPLLTADEEIRAHYAPAIW